MYIGRLYDRMVTDDLQPPDHITSVMTGLQKLMHEYCGVADHWPIIFYRG